MAFSILEYISALEAKLTKLSRIKRMAFAMWCCHFLWKRFSGHLATGIGSDNRNRLSRLMDAFWDYMIHQKTPPKGVVDEAKSTLKRIESSDARLDGGSELANFGIVELLGCIQRSIDVFENGSAKSASICSEHVINLIDYELAFLSEEKNPFSHPEMVNEIARQNNMLVYLDENNLVTEEDKNRFRY